MFEFRSWGEHSLNSLTDWLGAQFANHCLLTGELRHLKKNVFLLNTKKAKAEKMHKKKGFFKILNQDSQRISKRCTAC